ncbi:MAG: Flp pilus assembly complex ATPase component TadA [Hahellaceae bacterium]|nr:Flp pilus assembly complex ATPase component TadA [Hahellaceae bacterium]
MLQITLFHKNGRHLQSRRFQQSLVSIGKGKDCDLIQSGWSLNRTHCEVAWDSEQVTLIPNQDAHCYLNGHKIIQPTQILETDHVRLGAYRLEINRLVASDPTPKDADFETPENAQGSEPIIEDLSTDRISTVLPSDDMGSETPESIMTNASSETANSQVLKWQRKIHQALLNNIDLRRIQLDELHEDELRQKMTLWIREIIHQFPDFPKSIEEENLVRRVADEAIGLGPLEDLMRNSRITEIMVNAHDQIFYEEQGRLKRSHVAFSSPQAVLSTIERIVSPLGRRIDESSPMVDARLKDGSRVNAIVPPLALKGPCITIRKFSEERLAGEDLVGFGSMSPAMLSFLQSIVSQRQNLVISGGTGSGKTTLLNVLSGYIPKSERIVTVEDAAELRLPQPNLVSLEARPSNQEGKGAVHIRDLVRNCLRMRPDRIVVGECRGGEALDMLQAMNTGHDGSLTTAHANSPRDCLSRLEVMVLMAGMDLPVTAIREQIASAVHFIVQQTRYPCGSRKVTSICEVNGLENGIIQLSEIFRFQARGFDSGGKVLGDFEATGLVPDFVEKMHQQGRPVSLSWFQREGGNA